MEGSLLPLALVTGAARRVGRTVALELARQGFAIGLHAHHSAREAESTAAEITELGVPVYRFTADLTDPAQIEQMFDGVAEISNPLRVLVNSAGIMQKGDLREMPVEAWDKTLDLNLRAPWLCARAAVKLMAARPEAARAKLEAAGERPASGSGGVIINITDSGAQKAWTSFPAYIVSKAGLEALTRLMARAFAPEVRVNAVAPGLILPSADMPPEAWQRLVDRLPLKAAGQPEDVARAVVFFVQNPYVTGQTLAVDGGYQLV